MYVFHGKLATLGKSVIHAFHINSSHLSNHRERSRILLGGWGGAHWLSDFTMLRLNLVAIFAKFKLKIESVIANRLKYYWSIDDWLSYSFKEKLQPSIQFIIEFAWWTRV